jgi:branched-chain amino acid transport system permease protein
MGNHTSVLTGTGTFSIVDRLKRYAIWIGAAAALFVLPRVFTSGAAITTLCLMGIMVVFSLSYNLLLGQTGMLSFGHAVYYGLGGFLAVHAMNIIAGHRLPIPLPAVPLVGGLMGLLFGVIFGSVSTRRAGTAFAMISLGLGELIASLSLILRGFFGGEEGVTANRTKTLILWGVRFGPQIEVYYLIAAWCFLCVALMYGFTRTPLGRLCNAVRDNPERAAFVGYSTQIVRFIVFCISGFFAGIAGGLAAINFELMNAVNISGAQSGVVLLMALVGGVGHFVGPILGAILVVLLQVFLSDLTGAWMLYFGLLFVTMVMFAPGGLAGLLMLHLPLVRRRTLHLMLPHYAVMAVPAVMGMAGLVTLVETAHHQFVRSASEGTAMRLFGVSYDSNNPLAWFLALGLIAAAILLGRFWGPKFAEAFSRAAHGEVSVRDIKGVLR